ncbi:hypothetical protein [Hoeflea ulvae]|uniref:Uncharacterized protein n=1 Tax=Hoeflea ulvae TaxID=2983764 RepID=A0ABT3YDF3_9HYPH|nr:hypothetical protein [Hoeflea ulvae]MCY0093906.1 hypothetical protein [Hoeflea ulvae]
MEFSFGAVVFLASMLLLAVLARLAASRPDAAVLRGEIAPALLSVLVTGGLLIGFLAMVFGGESYIASRTVEVLVIVGFAIIAFWGIRKLVGRFPAGHFTDHGQPE